MNNITVIIPNFNGQEFLPICLKSLKEQNIDFKAVIIDNGSSDKSVEFLTNNYPQFNYILNPENLGFATAVNQGIEASNSEYVLILNNDVELGSESILNLLKCIKNDENIFAVSSKMIQYNDRTKIDDAGDEYTIFGWTWRVSYGKSADKCINEREIFSACAGAALYRRSVFDEIGYFDENFFAYLEDVDISYRARINGYKCFYCPGAVVYHVGSMASGSMYNKFKIRLSARNNIYVPYKNMPWPQLMVNATFLLLGFLVKYLFFCRQGYGNVYLNGLKEGFNSLKKIDKVKYTNKNFKNYLNIEWFLLKNTFKFVFRKLQLFDNDCLGS